MSLHPIRVLSILIFTINVSLMNAQFINYGIKEGLSFKSVDHLITDDEDLIYAGTNESLDVLYGNSFNPIKPLESKEVRNHITSLLFLKKGYILIGIAQKGLFLYNKYNETLNRLDLNHDIPEPLSATALTLDNKGVVWVGCSNGSVFTIKIDQIIPNRDNSTKIKVTEVAKMPSQINDIYAFHNEILIASNTPELIHIKNRNEKIILLPHIYLESATKIYRIKHVDSTLLIGTDNGLFKIDRFLEYQSNNSHIKPWLLPQIIIRSLTVHNSIIWAGTEGNGLFKLSPNGNILNNFTYSENKRSSINSNYILETFVDKSNHLWIGTWLGGLNMLDLNESKFRFVYDKKNENNLFSNVLWSLEKTRNDEIYIGTHGNGLAVYNRKEKSFESILKTASINSISTIYFDSDSGILFIGTWGNGIWVYNTNTHKLVSDRYDFELLKSDRIYDITKGPNGKLWIGSYYNGLMVLLPKEKKLKPIPLSKNSVDKIDVRCLYTDTVNNRLYIGSLKKGVFELTFDVNGEITNRKHFEHFTDNNEKISPESMYMGEDSNLWLLCRNGLGTITNDGKAYRLPQLQEKVATALCKDKQGNFWVSTYEGIFKINKESLTVEPIIKGHSFYDLIFIEKENLVLAASDDGLLIANPQINQTPKPTPSIFFNNLKVLDQDILPNKPAWKTTILNKRLNYSDTIILPYFAQTFSFNLSHISYNKNQQSKIRYRIKDFDAFWNETNNKSANVSYSNLPSGNYIFQAQTTTENKAWNTKIRELVIVKQEPWWFNFWAKLIYSFFLLSSGYIIFKFIKERIRIKQELKIEKIKHEQENNLYNQKISFFTNVSHDIRTPLTLIIGPIEEVVSNPKLDHEVYTKLQRVLKNSRMLLNLVNQILDFRKVETKNLNINKKQINLNHFLQNTYYQFNELADNKSIDFELNLQEDELTLVADPVKLESVLFNLISNAIKFTPKYGHILIESFKEKEKIIIGIQDSGIGIHPDEINHIFTRFYTSKLNNFSSGSGIGMALVKSYIEAHNGGIQVTSNLDSGTKFTVSFPVLDTSSYKEHVNPPIIDLQTTSPTLINSTSTLEKKNSILIIDDNPEILNYLKDILKKNYNVLTANNGALGLDIAIKKIPDLIISDVMMDIMDGFELCSQLKSHITTSHIPIILLTAKNSPESRIEGFEKGADAYIEKPFNSNLLLIRIEKIILSREKLKKKFLISDSFSGDAMPSSIDKEILDNIVAQIEKHISESDFSVQSLIDIVNMSQDQLYRKIKALSGLSINHFIRKVRLNKAAKLIAEGRYSISEVVYKVGFNNPSYFTKCFKAEFGMSPSDYINEKKNINQN